MDVKSTLKKYIAEEMLHEAGAGRLEDDAPLIEGGIIDSMNLIRLVAFIEERFGIKIEGEELDIDNFRTLAALSAFVQKKGAGR